MTWYVSLATRWFIRGSNRNLLVYKLINKLPPNILSQAHTKMFFSISCASYFLKSEKLGTEIDEINNKIKNYER